MLSRLVILSEAKNLLLNPDRSIRHCRACAAGEAIRRAPVAGIQSMEHDHLGDGAAIKLIRERPHS
jgi:hypothetical protein